MRSIAGLVYGAVIGGSIVAGAAVGVQTPPADAAAGVLAAARQALGGEQKIAAVKTLVATGRTRQVRGDNLVPIEFEIAIEFPDRYVRRDEIPAQESGPTTSGFNGPELIQFPIPTAPGGRGPLVTPERGAGPPREGGPPAGQPDAARVARLAAVRQDFARLTLGLFATSFTSVPLTFSYVAKAEAPEGKADVIAVSGPDNFSARLFVNAETHLPILVTWTPPSPAGRGRASAGQAQGGRGGGPVTPERSPSPAASQPASAGQSSAGREGGPPAPPPESRLFYADYREVSGLKLPFRLRRAVGTDTVEETTFDSFKINAKIDPKKFEVRK
jgi:hypothetical protein